jgi:hypothetical protein
MCFTYPNPHVTLFARPLRFATDLSCLKLQYQYTINGRANSEHMVKVNEFSLRARCRRLVTVRTTLLLHSATLSLFSKKLPKMELKKIIWII